MLGFPRREEVESILLEILASRQITSVEQTQLRDIFLTTSLTQTEQTLINRLFYGVRHGLLSTVD